MFKEFKEFAMKGNVVDLAVAVIIGAAFGKIVASLVEDIIMPVVGKLTGGLDFSNMYLPLSDKVTAGLALADARKLGAVLAWGNFVTIVINFLIIAFCIFLVVKALNSMKKPAPNAPATTKDCPACTMTIPVKATRCPHCTTELATARA
ncbi:MAG: large conductance mechanosensitive channel protein MscL [Chthoniobacterales bacterium]